MMRRKFLASFFLTTMSFLIVFQHPVFAYCDCSDEIILEPCHCEHAGNEPCSHENSSDSTIISNDCNRAVELDVDHFVIPLQESKLSHPVFSTLISPPSILSRSTQELCKSQLAPIRGSPPLLAHFPLYLKHSVFRL